MLERDSYTATGKRRDLSEVDTGMFSTLQVYRCRISHFNTLKREIGIHV